MTWLSSVAVSPAWPLPLRAIHADDCPNLFVAGRCMFSDHTVIDVTRAIGTCAVTGETCGVTAAILIKNQIGDRVALLEKPQKTLIRAGALINPRLVTPHPKAVHEKASA